MSTVMQHHQSVQQLQASPDVLASLRTVLRAELAKYSAEMAEHDPAGAEATDHAGALVERELAEVVATRRAQIIDEIAEAIARIDAGTYGTCQACGIPIPLERLEAIPHSRFCVACQTVRPRLLSQA